MNKGMIEFTDTNFAEQVESGDGITVVDFWAPWCGPCRFVGPLIEELAEEYEGRVQVGKLNVDEAPRTAAKYGIRSIPTIAVFRDGEPVDGILGAVPMEVLREAVDKQLAVTVGADEQAV